MGGSTKINVSINDKSELWGHGDERLDGDVYFESGQWCVSTFRGVEASGNKLTDALNDVAKQLGYSRGARLIVPADRG